MNAQKSPTPPAHPKTKASVSEQQLPALEQLQAQLTAAQDQAKRAQADYHNLQRRTQEDRIRWSKLACREVIESLLDPYQHLQWAAAQVQNPGLTMVVQQFEQAFAAAGLEPVATVGQPFNPVTMEAVEGSQADGTLVSKINHQGYTLNGELIRHAKVLVTTELEKTK